MQYGAVTYPRRARVWFKGGASTEILRRGVRDNAPTVPEDAWARLRKNADRTDSVRLSTAPRVQDYYVVLKMVYLHLVGDREGASAPFLEPPQTRVTRGRV